MLSFSTKKSGFLRHLSLRNPLPLHPPIHLFLVRPCSPNVDVVAVCLDEDDLVVIEAAVVAFTIQVVVPIPIMVVGMLIPVVAFTLFLGVTLTTLPVVVLVLLAHLTWDVVSVILLIWPAFSAQALRVLQLLLARYVANPATQLLTAIIGSTKPISLNRLLKLLLPCPSPHLEILIGTLIPVPPAI